MKTILIIILCIIIILYVVIKLINKVKGGRASPFNNTFNISSNELRDLRSIGLSKTLGLHLINPLPLLAPSGEEFLKGIISEDTKYKYLIQTMIGDFKVYDIAKDPLDYIIKCNLPNGELYPE